MADLLRLSHIYFSNQGRAILHDVSLSVARGEIVTLIGPSGAGKTSLVRIALGLAKADAGDVVLSSGTTIGYMPQKLQLNTLLPLTVERFLQTAEVSRPTIRHFSELVAVTHLLDQPLQSLSGGEMQRVLLTRSLLHKPALLILDEPVQGVDVLGQTELYRLIQNCKNELDCGVLMVSHDLHLVMSTTDSVICLNKHVCCEGHPESVSAHPAYLELFGKNVEPELAVYTHHHNHTHDHNHHGCNTGAAESAEQSP